MSDSIFTKIINREIPSTIYFEDDDFIVIKDIKPAAPVHALIITKHPYQTLEEVAIDDIQAMGRLLQTARKVAHQLGIANNYKLFMNVGTDVQAVHHLHVHLMGGWQSVSPATTVGM